MGNKRIYIPFTHPKSAPRQAPFYAGLRVSDRRSSPATSSKLKIGETLNLQRFSYFYYIQILFVNVCKKLSFEKFIKITLKNIC